MEAKTNIEVINKIGQKITSTLNLNEVIETLYEYIHDLMDTDGFIIYIHNSSKNSLEAKYVLGRHKQIVANSIPMTAEDSFCVYSIKNKAEIYLKDVRKEYSKYLKSYYWASVPDEIIIHSFINIPLIMRDEAFGVISVQSINTNAYTNDHLEILKSLASYMSIAFNNAETYSLLNEAKESLIQQKQIIEQKNKDILDSIRYAKRIQTSLLPTEKYFEKTLKRLTKP